MIAGDFMKLFEAFRNGISKGKCIVSCQGKEYSPLMLNLSWLNEYTVIYDKGMNEAERKGQWKIYDKCEEEGHDWDTYAVSTGYWGEST